MYTYIFFFFKFQNCHDLSLEVNCILFKKVENEKVKNLPQRQDLKSFNVYEYVQHSIFISDIGNSLENHSAATKV